MFGKTEDGPKTRFEHFKEETEARLDIIETRLDDLESDVAHLKNHQPYDGRSEFNDYEDD